MNANHFDHKLVYTRKVQRLRELIADLEEAEKTMAELPEDIVQTFWLKFAGRDIPERTGKSKSISKGPFKKSLKKTLQALIVIMLQDRSPKQTCCTKRRAD
jgi:hypothetical protein